MTGLIWMVQLVHYPSFRFVSESFQPFHRFHSNRITWIVLPVMAVELITACVLALQLKNTLWILNLGGVLLIWAATALLSVPQHNLLAKESNAQTIKRLVTTNWVRTLLWTARSVVFILELALVLEPSKNA